MCMCVCVFAQGVAFSLVVPYKNLKHFTAHGAWKYFSFFFLEKRKSLLTHVYIYMYTWSCATNTWLATRWKVVCASGSAQENRSFTDCLENLKSSTQRGIEDRLLPFTLEIGLDQCGLCAWVLCSRMYRSSMARINIRNSQEPPACANIKYYHVLTVFSLYVFPLFTINFTTDCYQRVPISIFLKFTPTYNSLFIFLQKPFQSKNSFIEIRSQIWFFKM